MLCIRTLISVSIQLCQQASQIIKEAHENKNFTKYLKGVDDPFTDADLKVQTLMKRGFQHKFPKLKIIGQESKDYQGEILFDYSTLKDNILPQQIKIDGQIPYEQLCLWIDPIDGTKSFIKGNVSDVSVLIGLSFQKSPIIGVVALPYQRKQQQHVFNPKIIFGSVLSKVAYVYTKDKYSALIAQQLDLSRQLIVGRSYNNTNKAQNNLIQKLKAKEIFLGGCGQKIMLVALSQIDLMTYIQFKTSKWDTCGPEAIIKAIGGYFTTADKKDLVYDDIDSNAKNPAIICALHEKIYAAAIDSYH